MTGTKLSHRTEVELTKKGLYQLSLNKGLRCSARINCEHYLIYTMRSCYIEKMNEGVKNIQRGEQKV